MFWEIIEGKHLNKNLRHAKIFQVESKINKRDQKHQNH